jgi:hypothetical protein
MLNVVLQNVILHNVVLHNVVLHNVVLHNVVLQNVAAPIENIIQFMGRNYIIPSFVIREPNQIPDSYLLVNPLSNDSI